MAAADVVSVSTSLGNRELIALDSRLDLQKLESPQVSLFQCAQRFGPQTIRRLFEKIAERQQDSPFEELNLQDNNLGDEGALYLRKGLAGSRVRRLILLRANVGAAGFAEMGKLLADAPLLEELLLGGNEAGPEALGEDFCAGLAQNASIRSLVLSHNRLCDSGIVSLCKGPLRSHPSLEHIGLSYNRLGVPAIRLLNEVLAKNRELKHLDLGGNSLGEEGAELLVEGLKKNGGRIQKLNVDRNSLQLRGALAFTRFFGSTAGESLVYLDVRHNRIGQRGCVQIRKELGRPEDGCTLMFDNGDRQLLISGL